MAELAHIFVVDDDPSIRRMFQLLLSDTGYRVSTATSGEEALAYMDLITPDLILLDWMLPGINGQEVAARIKADTSKPFIPIIVVTARGDQKSKVAALDAGADDFLVKPVEFAELLARVRAMLRLQRSQRSLQAEQRKTELLLHLTRELGTTLDLDDLLTHFLDRLADAVGAVRASIILTNDAQPRLFSSTRARAAGGLEGILRDGIAGWVLRQRQPAIIDDTRNDDRWVVTLEAQRGVRSVASVPISREGQVLGVITLVHHTPGYFTAEHMDLLEFGRGAERDRAGERRAIPTDPHSEGSAGAARRGASADQSGRPALDRADEPRPTGPPGRPACPPYLRLPARLDPAARRR